MSTKQLDTTLDQISTEIESFLETKATVEELDEESITLFFKDIKSTSTLFSKAESDSDKEETNPNRHSATANLGSTLGPPVMSNCFTGISVSSLNKAFQVDFPFGIISDTITGYELGVKAASGKHT
ncbi:hypothetical protein M422DRAFT_46829 [Sphaerobolus stellatus SS14]|uniref:Uncharacterized protein n=1 Tax=Sphaerobolus stellatus (strain SS14) TaxID=990650 RepID=A0A0C9VSD9_SPHS4|nr:hypothetical protein M422DRAFT_46829 [Sphaerobolus stellatus SS14]